MAERYYSLHADEPIYMNYNVVAQQQQHLALAMGQQQQPAPLPPRAMVAAAALNGTEFDYLAHASYLTAATQPNAATDINNNISSSNMSNANLPLRYFGQAYSNSNSNCKLLPPQISKYAISNIDSNNMLLPAATDDSSVATGVASLGSISAAAAATSCHYALANGAASCYNRNRYMPYSHNRSCAAAAAATNMQQAGNINQVTLASYAANYQQQKYATAPAALAATTTAAAASGAELNICTASSAPAVHNTSADYNCFAAPATTSAATASKSYIGATSLTAAITAANTSSAAGNIITSTPYNAQLTYANVTDPNQTVTLQITNLDYSMDEPSLRNFLLNQLKPITPVVSLVFEGSSYAKVTVPDIYFAKQVVSNLHRKKIGHKRMLVSYTRDSSLTEVNTLRCQVAGLLKDVPYYTLPMYKFRELFQSRFKTSISVLDLFKMSDICSINTDSNEEKFITLQPELVNSLESSPLMEGLQHSVPYCTVHFKREQHKGWAEQDIEPLPNVCMTIAEIQQIIYPLLRNHPGDIPVASLVHCIEGELHMQITPNEGGVNLEHLICCVQGIQIQVNNFGIKILSWLEWDKDSGNGNVTSTGSLITSAIERGGLHPKCSVSDPLYQISREVIELVKMSPKSTMKFNRFIPAYHNHFGKQCRVADYGYTKLIELFEALSTVVQIMGDGENRQITLTHRTQIRRFTTDLLRVLRAYGNKSVLLSQLPIIFAQTQSRHFDVTDYGVCDIVDILDGLVNSNIVVVSTVQNGKDILISIPKRKQTNTELEKTSIFASEMVELFRNAPQYTILFQKFVRSYHYHFAYQCRLSDYGFLKLADLMEAIQGVVELEVNNDEDRKIFLSPKVACRVFAEQCEELIRSATGSSKTCMKLEEVLNLHKKKFGYQIQPQTLGVKEIPEAMELLPYVELLKKEDETWIICHSKDDIFRRLSYRACKHLLSYKAEKSSNPANSTSKTHEEKPTSKDKQKPIHLKDFINEFNAKHKENLTEQTVLAMKHAIVIYKDNAEQCVRLSKFMEFLLSIVRLLEQRSTMLLHEIKQQLDCGMSATFEFGFPNLSTILVAYQDIFAVNLSTAQDRSEISLQPNCELRLSGFSSHQHLFGTLKLPHSKIKSTRSTRPTPLGDYNSRANAMQGPPAKTRAMSIEVTHHSVGSAVNSALYATPTYRNYLTNINGSYYQAQSVLKPQPQPLQQAAVYSCNKSLNSVLSQHNNSSNTSLHSTGSQHTSSMLNTSASNVSSNKENSFNASFNLFNSSFNSSSNNSFSEVNASLGQHLPQLNLPPIQQASAAANSYITSGTAKLWDRRHTSYYQQQQPQTHSHSGALGLSALVLPPTTLNSSGGTGLSADLAFPYPPPVAPHAALTAAETTTAATTAPTAPPSERVGLYEFVSNMQMCPMYETPKPDTPPSDKMPFWIDPIWTNNVEPLKNDALDIKLPEMKTLNVLPMLLSPYTLSKNENMKQVFNFENHDRKIA